MNSKAPQANALIEASSPYLLQHAYNPVNWNPWCQGVLDVAKNENKLLIISIGYAACHWCHVMEKESFEDLEVAQVMNTYFVSIKVDREERPDIDAVYMKAVQIMTRQGGWPLNIVALPDGRPIWGGTYFNKEEWIKALLQLQELFTSSPEQMYSYGKRLQQGVQQLSLVTTRAISEDSSEFCSSEMQLLLKEAVQKASESFDRLYGGQNYAPKFMMPTNYSFFLRYAHQTKNTTLLKYTLNTLDKMAFGGIYDPIEGGFSRYAVDKRWHIPHFEKMLYDNAQLIGLYANAYSLTKDSLYKEVVYQTIHFLKNNWQSPEGGFYASFDADSPKKGTVNTMEEGAYYTWEKQELQEALKDTDYDLFAAYYQVNSNGFWHESNAYVFIRNQKDAAFCQQYHLSLEQLEILKKQWQGCLLKLRKKRILPALDDKILTSWNGLTLQGLCEAYRVFGEKDFLDLAVKNARFIATVQMDADARLWRNFKDGKSTINAYLEDYASVISGFIALYQVTFEEKWLHKAHQLLIYTDTYFLDPETQLYFFTSKLDAPLLSPSMECEDNVIPSSNAIMAKNLNILSKYFLNTSYAQRSKKMLQLVKTTCEMHPTGHTHWLNLAMDFAYPFYEMVLPIKNDQTFHKELAAYYLPQVLFCRTSKESSLPLQQGKYSENHSLIYCCTNNKCNVPVKTFKEAYESYLELV